MSISFVTRKRLALTTAIVSVAIGGYGRRAYAACDNTGGSTYLCTGANATTQTINANNAAVSTAPGFSVNTAAGNGITITGDGALSYTDANASPLTATAGDGLHVYNHGDDGLTPGSIAIDTNGDITGGVRGIYAKSYGTGATSINVDGNVTGTTNIGIFAANTGGFGTDMTITTGIGSSVTGVGRGIDALNTGTGVLSINVEGDVTGTGANSYGIQALGDGTDTTIATGASSNITGDRYGIRGLNFGHGQLEITVNGSATGTNGAGVYGEVSNGATDLIVTTGADSHAQGKYYGISAHDNGTGRLEITINGEATGTVEHGIHAYNYSGTHTDITVGATGLAQGGLAGVYAYSYHGQNIAITNQGEIRNLSTESFDLAINAHGGATDIDNSGLVTGTVELGDLADSFTNRGTWNTAGGDNHFGDDTDNVKNEVGGTIVAANLVGSAETTQFLDLETFTNAGALRMDDGGADDTTVVSGDFVGTNGRVVVDAVLASGSQSDQLKIEGNSSGTTNIVVRPTNPLSVAPNLDGITVVTVNGTTAEEDFNLEGGVLNAGFFAWDLRRDGNTHELFTTGLGAGSLEFAAGITGAQDLWYQTTGSLLQRQADLRLALGSSNVTPVADFSEPVEPTPIGHVTPGAWVQGIAAYLQREANEGGFDLDRDQTVYGILGGFDFGTENIGGQGDTLMFGILGGYLTSDLDFDETDTKWTYEGPTVGVYATYLNQAFYLDATIKADFLDVDIDTQGTKADTDVVNIGGLIDTGYKVDLAHSLFVEPQAALAVVHTEVDDIDDIFGGTVEFDDETSVRGRLGLRVGSEIHDSNATVYSSDVIVSVWQEFNGDNNATILAPQFPATGVSDDPGETFGDVSVGFNVISLDGWSGFLRGNWQFAEDFDALSGNAGIRYAW